MVHVDPSSVHLKPSCSHHPEPSTPAPAVLRCQIVHRRQDRAEKAFLACGLGRGAIPRGNVDRMACPWAASGKWTAICSPLLESPGLERQPVVPAEKVIRQGGNQPNRQQTAPDRFAQQCERASHVNSRACCGLTRNSIIQHGHAADRLGQGKNARLAPVAVLVNQEGREVRKVTDLVVADKFTRPDPGLCVYLSQSVVGGCADLDLLGHHVRYENRAGARDRLQNPEPAFLGEMTEKPGVEY
jgi:hypothetical protein